MNTKALVTMVSMLMVTACGSTNKDAATPAEGTAAYEGRWTSDGCEAMPDGKSFFQRDFTLTSSRWGIVFTLFGDASCTTKLLSADIGGPWTLGAPSKTVAGAREGEFVLERRVVTAHAQPLADALDGMKCGASPWKVGAPQDLLASGCPGLGMHPVASCPKEHDLVRVEGSRLWFGARPADGNLCTADKRPTALGAPLTKR